MTYVVPKDRQSVTLHFTGGAVRQGSIFLEYAAAELSPHQKIAAFLESPNAFFPLQVDTTGKTEFIQKKSIRLVELEYPDGGTDVSISLMHSIGVVLTFKSGIALSGNLLADVPEQKSRLSDCLNQQNGFLLVRVQGRLLFINKEELQQVVHAE